MFADRRDASKKKENMRPFLFLENERVELVNSSM